MLQCQSQSCRWLSLKQEGYRKGKLGRPGNLSLTLSITCPLGASSDLHLLHLASHIDRKLLFLVHLKPLKFPLSIHALMPYPWCIFSLSRNYLPTPTRDTISLGRDHESSIWIRSVSINVSACKALHKRLPESWSLHDRLEYSPGWATRPSKATFQEPFFIERLIYIKINCPGWFQTYLVSSLLLLLIIRVSRLYPVGRGIALEPTMVVTISDGLTDEG